MSDGLHALLTECPLPAPSGGKDSKGNLVVVGGAPSCPGAAILVGRAALRCGSGRVQLVVHPSVAAAVGAALPEALVLGWEPGTELPDAMRALLEDAAAAIVGPGLGREGPAAARAVGEQLADGVLVIDARAMDALDDPMLTQGPRWLAAPNPSEAARLVGASGEDADPDLADLAARVAKRIGGPAAVRGTTTVVDDGAGRQWTERAGTSGLGTPGSGDVLMGALGAFLARGADPLTALAWAVATHARAGEVLAGRHPVGFLASEIADVLPHALQQLSGSRGSS